MFYTCFFTHRSRRIRHVIWSSCASLGQAQSPLIDMWTIASSSTRTLPLPSLAVQRLTSCFKLLIFFSSRTRDRKLIRNELLWIHGQCHVASHTVDDLRQADWLDNVWRWGIASADSFSRHAGCTCFSSCHMWSWMWRQKQSTRNLNPFCRAPFRDWGDFPGPSTPSVFGLFFFFFIAFSQHAEFPLLYMYAWKKNWKFAFQNSPTENLKAGPPWFEFLVIFDFFAPWYRQSREASSVKIA